MGIEAGAILLSAVAAGATVGKMGFEAEAANEQTKALELEAQQKTLEYQQKTLSNYDVLQKVIDAQEAQMTTRGVAFTSPSFNAIQRATYNIGAKKQANTEIENDIAQENIDVEKSNVRSRLYAQLFGDASQLAFAGAGIAGKAPTKLPAMET